MSAYLQTMISGNENFGGYLSIDGGKTFAIGHDITLELSSGAHSFSIYSTSDAQRAAGKVQAFTYANTSSSGAILDTLEANAAKKNLGDSWEINVVLDDGDMCELHIVSRGREIIGNPQYVVSEMSEELIELYEARFQEMKEEQERAHEEWKNTPVRSKAQIIVGCILTGSGLISLPSAISAGEELPVIIAMIGMPIVGIILFCLGMKKKLRRK